MIVRLENGRLSEEDVAQYWRDGFLFPIPVFTAEDVAAARTSLEDMERDWLEKFWRAGLPKHHHKMHYFLNTFPHADGRGRPVGPETNPHSVLGFTKWLIEQIKANPQGRNEIE